jgi:anti-sigma-K factor RskA
MCYAGCGGSTPEKFAERHWWVDQVQIFRNLSADGWLNPIVMEPFSPQDPLHQLLGKSRQVEVRPDFTQNVLRAIRQEPEPRGLLERMREWMNGLAFSRPAYAVACAAILLAVALPALFLWQEGSAPLTAQVPAETMIPEPAAEPMLSEEASLETQVASELDNMNQLSVLLAQQDTSSLTDNEIALLLY